MLLKIIVLQLSLLFLTDFKDPVNDNYWIKQGDIALSKKNVEESIILYSRAINDRPKHALGYIKRSKAYREFGQLVKSADDMRRAIEIDPQYTKSYLETSKNRSVIRRQQ